MNASPLKRRLWEMQDDIAAGELTSGERAGLTRLLTVVGGAR